MFTRMHPIDFKNKWGLTYFQLASLLGYESDYTVKSWNFSGKRRRNPQGIVLIACGLLDEKWEKEGRQLI